MWIISVDPGFHGESPLTVAVSPSAWSSPNNTARSSLSAWYGSVVISCWRFAWFHQMHE